MVAIEWLLFGISLIGTIQTSAQTNARSYSQAKIIARSYQLVVVTTRDWNEVRGELLRYERTSAEQVWRPVGGKIPIVVGTNM